VGGRQGAGAGVAELLQDGVGERVGLPQGGIAVERFDGGREAPLDRGVPLVVGVAEAGRGLECLIRMPGVGADAEVDAADRDVARRCITSAACRLVSSTASLPLSSRMRPPAEATRLLNHTVRPSYCAPWISTRPGLPCWRRAIACSIIWSQVAGGVGTRSLRY